MPFLFRLATDLAQSQPAADQLHAAGYDRGYLRYILLTHAHWDHVSGAPDSVKRSLCPASISRSP
ncbi:MAG TPA: MBL fold metallo-hydrolase [Casimicrobiaceae bacterium]|nr:MBL fold metallo-hydrolase [Casimicrobiaceae bacterium]